MDNAQVTEADRKAAADLINTFPLSLGWADRDDLPTQLVEAFARHRLERSAPVAEIERLREALTRIQSLAACCESLPDTDGFRRAYRDIAVMAQVALGDAS